MAIGNESIVLFDILSTHAHIIKKHLERLNQTKDVIDNPMKSDKPLILGRYFGKRSNERRINLMRFKRILWLMSVFFCLSLAVWNGKAMAAEEINAPLLNGLTWVKMSQDQKAAYIWGVGDIIDLEQEIMELYPELKRDSFVTKAVEGIGDVKINAIVINVDAYYRENPNKANLTVIRVIWDTMIKPNIKTGIAGKPLQ
jgi:hypothetical protein